MPGVRQLLQIALVFGSVVSAHPKFQNARPRSVEIRQAPPAAAPPAAAPSPAPGAAPPAAPAPGAPAAGGLTDVDILQL
jgi:predicted lipid-binding transport protein (Tim44 family)